MNRRNFIKALCSLPVLAALPSVAQTVMQDPPHAMFSGKMELCLLNEEFQEVGPRLPLELVGNDEDGWGTEEYLRFPEFNEAHVIVGAGIIEDGGLVHSIAFVNRPRIMLYPGATMNVQLSKLMVEES